MVIYKIAKSIKLLELKLRHQFHLVLCDAVIFSSYNVVLLNAKQVHSFAQILRLVR